MWVRFRHEAEDVGGEMGLFQGGFKGLIFRGTAVARSHTRNIKDWTCLYRNEDTFDLKPDSVPYRCEPPKFPQRFLEFIRPPDRGSLRSHDAHRELCSGHKLVMKGFSDGFVDPDLFRKGLVPRHDVRFHLFIESK
jgi:hypothetical protein